MNITLQIDELVVHGIAANTAASVGDALREHLTALLTTRGLPRSLARDGSTGAIDGGTIHVRDAAPPRHIGRQLASAVYGALEHT